MRSRTMTYILAAGLAAFLAVGGLVSCSDDSIPTATGGTGTLRMLLVDAPAGMAGVESLEIVFDEVLVSRCAEEADSADCEWYTVLADTLPLEDRTFELLDLVNGVFATLGEVELEPGYYCQVRITLGDATLIVDGEPQELKIPSGYQSGIKLVGGFTIEPNVVTELVADFDVAVSLHEAPPGSGRYILRPTIHIVQKTLSGTISGTVLPSGIGAVVYALDPATSDTVTSTLPDTLTGEYMLQALLAGTYEVTASAAGYVDSTRTGIVVTAGADTPDIDFTLDLEATE